MEGKALPWPLCLLRWEENGYKGVLKHLMRWSVLFPGTAGLRGSRGRGAGHRLGRGGVRQGEGAGAALPCPAPLCPGQPRPESSSISPHGHPLCAHGSAAP